MTAITDTITDAITGQRITVFGSGYGEVWPTVAGRTGVTIKIAGICTPDELDNEDADELDLTIEGALRLARKILIAAGVAMDHDPGPWRFSRTDLEVLHAAVDAHNTDATAIKEGRN